MAKNANKNKTYITKHKKLKVKGAYSS